MLLQWTWLMRQVYGNLLCRTLMRLSRRRRRSVRLCEPWPGAASTQDKTIPLRTHSGAVFHRTAMSRGDCIWSPRSRATPSESYDVVGVESVATVYRADFCILVNCERIWTLVLFCSFPTLRLWGKTKKRICISAPVGTTISTRKRQFLWQRG